MAQQDKPKKSVKTARATKKSMKSGESSGGDSVKRESSKKESIKRRGAKKDSVKRDFEPESTRKETITRVKQDSIKPESTKRRGVKKDSIKKESAPEPIKYDPHILAQSLHNADNIATLLPSVEGDFSPSGFDDEDSNSGYTLRFVRGSLKKNEATFIKMLGGEEFIMLPKDAITHILGILQESKEESLKLMLRYAIKDLLPLDLEDAMSVAIYELESQRLENGNFPTINIKNLAKKIRLKHPNLFFGTG